MSAETLLQRAQAQGVTLTTAESCTGGMVSAAITDVPGSSTIFDRGFVTYTNAAKMQMLGVQRATLDAYGAVSEPTAGEMAHGALAHSDADLAVAITGIAGPGGSDHKPEGQVCFATHSNQGTFTETVYFGALGRDMVRKAATTHAIDLLLQAIDSFSI